VSHAAGGLYRLLERAAGYERFQRLLGARRARRWFVAEVLKPRAGQRLLDIGCGTGSLLDDLPEGVEYLGLDFNAGYLDAARRRHGVRGSFVCTRVEELRADSWSAVFDLVVAKGVLHHLADAVAARLVALAHASLAPGGRLVTIDPVRHASQPWPSRLLMALDRGRCIRDESGYLGLVRERFPSAGGELRTDLLAVPYAHLAIRAPRA
jgi:SAM-dependent methyltransferase